MTVQIQLRRDTAANWASANPALAAGEAAFATDTGALKIGDGVTAYASLALVGGSTDAVTTRLGANQNIFDMADTWNNGVTVFTAIKMDVTDTASDASSLLMDLQVGSSSMFSVTKDGRAFVGDGTEAAPAIAPLRDTGDGLSFATNAIYFAVHSVNRLKLNNAGGSPLRIRDGISFGATVETPDVVLTRDAANTIALRNGTAAQAYNIYNTWTDASNHERIELNFSGNDAYLQTTKAGTGSARSLFIRGQGLYLGGAQGANHWRIHTDGNLLAQTDNVNDIGADGANRPRDLFIARNVHLTGLPTSDPTDAGQLWNNSGVLTVSAG